MPQAKKLPRCNRQELLMLLDSVTSGVTTKDTIEQSSCFCFDGTNVRTFSGDMYAEAPCTIPIEGAVFAGYPSGDGLLEALRRIPDDEVELEMTSARLVVRSKGPRVGVHREPDITLPWDQVPMPDDKDWQPLHEDFGSAVNLVGPCAGKDTKAMQNHPMGETLLCVHLIGEYVEASDDIRFARYHIDTPITDVCLRWDHIKHVPRLGMTQIAELDRWVFFRNPAGVMLGALKVLVDYPDIGSIFEKTGTLTSIPKALAIAAENAGHFSKGMPIRIRFSENRVRIRGEGEKSWYDHPRTITYDGPPISFRVSPEALEELAKSHSQAEIIENEIEGPNGKPIRTGCLKVAGGRWSFVTALDVDEKRED